ncbi:anhydro-N-acetylmuramic acid kinase [Microlunatus sp. Gsoil 973]|uniref:anhydro-N-acetylmuramic acid kinase n=1 Tax=Microlunatus sp. Gsoil 973 TaxID=2672569 RepID=UPI0012B4C4DC|nr:anhydro-N-acetylmuramic acid kinase [Microlunatus sp. Gsoil 973]QGN33638.1 anhydro-N-acetylmuramic acid kinase [Microlunatus sp. Gsoil 973]
MSIRIAGMMSGTSYDAVDVAVAEFTQDGVVLQCRPVGMVSAPLSPAMRSAIAALLPPNTTDIGAVCRLDTELGRLFGRAAAGAVGELGPVDLVVSHGQTVFHWVEDRAALGTLQLGSPAWIAEATGTPVLSDLRTRDIARGGQGAPLAAILDSMLVLSDRVRRGSLNLGGIANITVADPDLVAYDLGPASALMDLAVSRATGGAERMDTDGRRAERGEIDRDLLDRLLAEPYYRLPPPKSTGKELFDADYLDRMVAGRPIGLDDLVATLTELTAQLVARACRQHRLAELVVAGGGVANPTLMARIEALAGIPMRSIDEFGLPAQAKEAYLMTLVGYLSWHGLPGTLASATGASSVLGSITPGRDPLRLPETTHPMPERLVIIS